MTTLTITGTFSVAAMNSRHVVYMHMDADDLAIKYVGCTMMDKLFEFEDARCNNLWPGVFLIPGKQMNMAIDSIHDDEKDAIKRQHELIRTLTPICNTRGYLIAPHRQNILCNETGERWSSIREACKAHNLTASALSNHLNNKPGHITVKGRTYRRQV